ncbi:hypothetical protein M427DRAFT_371163 [Gonapodya prolifera JEL478]|uniref:WD40 repeat-like protein n=1 Tax=Gonapodya prolifera (strain JEL478) TaxID=1344416 RepID=A0A139A9Q1_GONPJ|nr:hypothetical protein M427DRAFT_371163 [Gonapodya prolifera JEL478]|eukprot:KXS13398.1 hypothetical protein M427DRAFT_371163 [Gonapodya prolifera JEL478]
MVEAVQLDFGTYGTNSTVPPPYIFVLASTIRAFGPTIYCFEHRYADAPGSPTSSGTAGYIPDPAICVVQGAKKSVLVLSVWSNSTATWIGNVPLDIGEADGTASVDRGTTFLVGKADWRLNDRMATVVGVVGERVAIGHSDGSILLGPLSLIYTHFVPVGVPPTPESVSSHYAHSDSTSILELHLHAAHVLCIASYATPTKEVLVSGSWESLLRFWDCKDGACIARKDDHSGGCIGAHVIPKGSKREGCVAAWWGDGGVSLIEGEGFRTLLSISHPRQRPTSSPTSDLPVIPSFAKFTPCYLFRWLCVRLEGSHRGAGSHRVS